MLTDKQQFVLDKAKKIIAEDTGSIRRIRDSVKEFCIEQGVCTRCHCRWADPLHKNCARCLAYKRIHKLHAKDKAGTIVTKGYKRVRRS